jgi:hypothetical protein
MRAASLQPLQPSKSFSKVTVAVLTSVLAFS